MCHGCCSIQLLHVKQGVRAVVTLNEDFEVFISTEQYKVWWPVAAARLSCQRPTHLRAAQI